MRNTTFIMQILIMLMDLWQYQVGYLANECGVDG